MRNTRLTDISAGQVKVTNNNEQKKRMKMSKPLLPQLTTGEMKRIEKEIVCNVVEVRHC